MAGEKDIDLFLRDEIPIEEMQKAIKKLHKKKVPGHDCVTSEQS